MSKFKSGVSVLFEWINRRWIVCTLLLTIVFWIVTSNILVGFMLGFFVVVFLIMIHAIILLQKPKDKK